MEGFTMSTKTMTTRRAVLAGAAYAAATIPPSIALVAVAAPAGSSALDPIFPALAAHARAWSAVEASIAAAGVIEDALGEDGADHTRLILSRDLFLDPEFKVPVRALSHEDIDRHALDWGWRPDERSAAHAAFDAETRRLEAIHQTSGLKAARARIEVAFREWKEQLRATAATVPTSAPGIAGFVHFIRKEIFDYENGSPGEDIEARAWRSLEAGLADLAAVQS
jgi:hypothetical protein